MKEWDPEAAILSMSEESRVLDTSWEAQTARILTENAPAAALSLVHIALHGHTEATRLQASRLIIDRTLGRLDELGFREATADENPLMDFVKNINGVSGYILSDAGRAALATEDDADHS